MNKKLEKRGDIILDDVCSSAEQGFVSSSALLGFETECDWLDEFGLSNIKKIIQRTAAKNTLENLYSLAKSSARVGDANYFNEYQIEAREIVQKYKLNKKKSVENRFNEIWRGY